jgi:lipoprotein NlpD
MKEECVVSIPETVAEIAGAAPCGVPPLLALRHAAAAASLAALFTAALGGCTITPWPSSDAASDAAPKATQAALPAAPSDAAPGYYRVKAGDTLNRIATAHSVRVADIASWNKLNAASRIQVGQLLRVAPPDSAASAPSATNAAAPTAADHGKSRFVWPIAGRVSSPFVAGKSKGVVIEGVAGQPVKVVAPGRVVYAGGGIKAYGELVIVKHDAQLITAYGRNSKLLVKEGDAVRQGQVIAQSGTDAAGKASLVFEVRENGTPVDPAARLPAASP